eukprot:gene14879-biopygen4074
MICTDNRDSVLSVDRVLRRLRSRPCVLRSGSSALRPAASASSSVQLSGSSAPRPGSCVQCPVVLVLSCARVRSSCVRVQLRSCPPAFCSQDPAFCDQDPALCVQLQSRSPARCAVVRHLRSAPWMMRSRWDDYAFSSVLYSAAFCQRAGTGVKGKGHSGDRRRLRHTKLRSTRPVICPRRLHSSATDTGGAGGTRHVRRRTDDSSEISRDRER